MILCACLHSPSLQHYWPGLRHKEIVREVIQELHSLPDDLVFGFLDLKGDFFDRRYAMIVAEGAGQVREGTGSNELTSEMIY